MRRLGAKQIRSGVTPQTLGTSNQLGQSNDVALADHVHAHGAQTDPTAHATATELAAGFMSAADKTKLAGIASGADVTTTALAGATASVSVNGQKLTNVGTPSATADAATKGYVDSATAAISAVQLDTTGTPANIGTAARGSAPTAAHADHVHAHGSHTDPSHHALATTSTAGFLSAADFAKLLSMAAGVRFVRARATMAINLAQTSGFGGGPVDGPGTTLVANDLLLLTSQADAKQNGIYKIVDPDRPSTWVRADGASVSTDFVPGGLVYAVEGTYGKVLYVLETKNVVLGTTNISYRRIAGLLSDNTPSAGSLDGSPGDWDFPSRGNHSHPHGDLSSRQNATSSAYHHVATTTVNGFMSAADKTDLGAATTKLAGIAAGADVTTTALAAALAAISVNGQKITNVGTPTASADAATKAYVDTATAGISTLQLDSTGTPSNIGTANRGTATTAAHADHVHAHGSHTDGTHHAVATTSVAGFMSAADKTKLDGVSSGATALALATLAPADVGATAVLGASAKAAKEDHVHAHGAQTDGAAHEVVTTLKNGFMSYLDKLKLDAVPSNADNTIGALSAASGPISHGNQRLTSVGAPQSASDAATKAYVDSAAAAATTPLSAVAPQAIGSATAGTATSASKSDHVHAHGNQAAGSLLHAAADGTNNGFMSAAHYTRLETLKTGVASSLGRVTVEALYEAPTANNAATGSVNLDVSLKNDFSLRLTGNAIVTLTNGANGAQGNIWVQQDATGNRTLNITAAGATRITEKAAASIAPQAEANTLTHYSYSFITINSTLYFMLYRTFLEAI